MTRLSPGSKFIEDCVIDALLGGEKALEVVSDGHGLCLRCNLVSGPAEYSECPRFLTHPVNQAVAVHFTADLLDLTVQLREVFISHL